LASQTQTLETQMEEDIQIMEEIDQIVYRAENPEQVNNSSSSQSQSTTKWIFLAIGGLLVIGLIVGIILTTKKPSRKPGHASTHPYDRKSTSESAHPQNPACLVTRDGFRFRLEGDILHLGRASDCQLRIEDSTVSRHHATLRIADGNWYIQDDNSSVGMFVNGERVRAARLYNDDKVGIGTTILTFKEG
jgi:hypothetical protein